MPTTSSPRPAKWRAASEPTRPAEPVMTATLPTPGDDTGHAADGAHGDVRRGRAGTAAGRRGDDGARPARRTGLDRPAVPRARLRARRGGLPGARPRHAGGVAGRLELRPRRVRTTAAAAPRPPRPPPRQLRAAAGAAVPGGADGVRLLVGAPRRVDAGRRPARLPALRAVVGEAGRPRADTLRARPVGAARAVRLARRRRDHRAAAGGR